MHKSGKREKIMLQEHDSEGRCERSGEPLSRPPLFWRDARGNTAAPATAETARGTALLNAVIRSARRTRSRKRQISIRPSAARSRLSASSLSVGFVPFTEMSKSPTRKPDAAAICCFVWYGSPASAKLDRKQD